MWTGLPQTEASFFQALRRRAFINGTKPGGPGASRAVGEKQGAESQGGALHGGADLPRPASQPERASVSRPPPARIPESASSAAPDPGGSAAPLGTDTNSSRRSCPASCLGNETQWTDVTRPSRSNGNGLSFPARVLRSRSSRRRRGGAWAGRLGLWWPGSNLCWVGDLGRRCPLALGWPGRRKLFVARCARHADIFLADRAFVATPSYCPVSVLALFPHQAPVLAPVLLVLLRGDSTGCFSSPWSPRKCG